MSELVKVELKNLFRTEDSGGGVFLGNDEKTFAIFIGPGELNALILAGGGIKTPRPLTHNLLDTVLRSFAINVQEIVITDLVNDAFRAALTLEQAGRTITIDCRPSDALVIAVMQKKPVFVTRDLFNKVEDGELLLAAMQEELRKAAKKEKEPEQQRPSEKGGKKGARPQPKKGGVKPQHPGSPEGELGDVRDIPGIDWKSLGL